MRQAAFTLAELLVALVILGLIATFAIPKVLQSQQDTKFKSIAKETAATLSSAYQAYKLQNNPATTTPTALMAYMNYVSVDTSSTLDGAPVDGGFTYDCGGAPTTRCLKLHNGASLFFWSDDCFSGTSNLHIIWYLLDPDGKLTTNGDSVWYALYYTGNILSMGSLRSGSTDCGGTVHGSGSSSFDPSWFSWS